MSGSTAAKVKQLEKKIEDISRDDNGPVFVLVIGVDAKSYCLIDGEKVYDGPEFERAKREWGQNRGPIEVISEPLTWCNEDNL